MLKLNLTMISNSVIDYNLAMDAFNKLDLNIELNRLVVVNFSNRFKAHGSNVTYSKNKIEFKLSGTWQNVNSEVVIGLFQYYFLRIFKMKKSTYYIELYDNYIKHVNKIIKISDQDVFLKSRFDFLNDEYFLGLLGETNLVWSAGKRTLGKFDYHTNTIHITKYLKKYPELLDYVLFHEMCHKKALFYKTNHKTMHHTGFFRDLENIYPNHVELEKKLNRLRL